MECKIADFGISNNLAYEDIKLIALYTSLIPPECKANQKNFNTKGDVYVKKNQKKEFKILINSL